jgi:hypothetical protein
LNSAFIIIVRITIIIEKIKPTELTIIIRPSLEGSGAYLGILAIKMASETIEVIRKTIVRTLKLRT